MKSLRYWIFLHFSLDKKLNKIKLLYANHIRGEILKEIRKTLIKPSIGPGQWTDFIAEPLMHILVCNDASYVLTNSGCRHAFLEEESYFSVETLK